MFTAETENESSFGILNNNDENTSHPPFLHRSLSAPAIAEHVSDAILPEYDDFDASDSNVDPTSSYYNNHPSRLNPRMPKPVRAFHSNDSSEMPGFEPGGFFEEGNQRSILGSLIMDGKPMTPVDKIQEDFPSTPSAVYSSRLAKIKEMEDEQDLYAEEEIMSAPILNMPLPGVKAIQVDTAPLGTSQSSSSLNHIAHTHSPMLENNTSLEQATMSLKNMYVSGNSEDSGSEVLIQSQGQQANDTQQHQQQAHQHSPQLQQNMRNHRTPSASQAMYGNNGMNSSMGMGTTVPNLGGTNTYTMQDIGMSMGQQPQFVRHQQMSVQYPGQMNMSQQMMPMTAQTTSGQQPHFYLPQQPSQVQAMGHGNQAVYMDPVYYRVQNGPAMGMYQQELVYSAPVDAVGVGPQEQMSYIQYQTPHGNFWQNGTGQAVSSDSQVVLLTSGNVAGRDMGMMPVSRRVVPMYTHQQGMPMDQANGMRSFVPNNQVQGQVQMPHRQPQQHMMNGMSMSPPPMVLNNSNINVNKMQSNNVNTNVVYKQPDQMKMYDNAAMSPGGSDSPGQYQNSTQGGGSMDSMDSDRYGSSVAEGGAMNGRDRGSGSGRSDRDKDRNSNGRNSDRGRGSTATVPPVVRDTLVEDFRNTYGKSRQWELRDLLGHVVAFCQDQHGSRFIQQRLEVASESEKQVIFDEVMSSAHSLMTDVFGNYVIQKLFEYGAPEQCETLASLISGQAVPLALQMYGCRVIQKALEYVSTQRLVSLVSEFEGSQVLRCVHDQNGNHVIQKCIEVVCRVAKEAPIDVSEYLNSRIQFIILSFQGRVRELSMHPYGCRVVQRILEHCNNQQKGNLLEELRLCCIELVQDQYGNYVIQHVMQHGWEADRAILVKEVQEHLLDFSQHKFASNVVEKCLQYASKKDRDEMIWTIIKVTFDLNNPVDAKTGHCVLESMVRDPYANYVVQKVIDVSDERQRGAIIKYVRENIVQLRRYTYGKHIIVRLEKVSGEKF
mmetsp:Transcript_5288/g.5432  ORF Transcript_5288/g.5432 Transcript_5288/m.5432 type:complete len:995 (+) Transcript_5288:122-3106(+)